MSDIGRSHFPRKEGRAGERERALFMGGAWKNKALDAGVYGLVKRFRVTAIPFNEQPGRTRWFRFTHRAAGTPSGAGPEHR